MTTKVEQPTRFERLGVPYLPCNRDDFDIEYWSCTHLENQWKIAACEFSNLETILPCRANILYKELKRRNLVDLSTEKEIRHSGQIGGMYYAKIFPFREEIVETSFDKILNQLRANLENSEGSVNVRNQT